MKKRNFYFIFFSVFFMVQSQVFAMESGSYYLYQLSETEDEVIVEEYIGIEEIKDLHEKEEILGYAFQKLFAAVSENDLITLIPEGTNLIGLQLVDGHLDLNVSKEILQYGGSRWEYLLVNQILATAYSYEAVESVSLLIEGKETYLPEGTMIIDYSKQQWKERMNIDNGTNRPEARESN